MDGLQSPHPAQSGAGVTEGERREHSSDLCFLPLLHFLLVPFLSKSAHCGCPWGGNDKLSCQHDSLQALLFAKFWQLHLRVLSLMKPSVLDLSLAIAFILFP